MIKFKKVFLLFAVLSSNIFAGAIYDNGTSVGIGTTSPSGGALGGRVLHLKNNGGTASLRVDRSDAALPGTISISAGNYSNGIFSTGAKDFAFATNSVERMRIDSNGNVIIGTISPFTFDGITARLSVKGLIAATDIKVRPSSQFPDYVFEDSYDLMSLDALKTRIRKDKHLPGIPSQKDIEEQGGINLGAMQVKLLKKIEELTLYMIDQNEKIEAQAKEIQALKNQNNLEKLVSVY